MKKLSKVRQLLSVKGTGGNRTFTSLCGTSNDPREGLLASNKIQFSLNLQIFLFLLYKVYKEKMFTIQVELPYSCIHPFHLN